MQFQPDLWLSGPLNNLFPWYIVPPGNVSDKCPPCKYGELDFFHVILTFFFLLDQTHLSHHAFRTGDSHGVPHQGVPQIRLQRLPERHTEPARAQRADGERVVKLLKVSERPRCCGQNNEGP